MSRVFSPSKVDSPFLVSACMLDQFSVSISSTDNNKVPADNNKVPGAKNEIDAVKTEVKTPE